MNKHATIICIFSTKGGIGRTTVTVNLAVALAQQGYKTALVDFDLQSGAADQIMGIEPDKTIDDLIQKGAFDNASDFLFTCNDNLSVLASPPRPTTALKLGSSEAASMLSSLRRSFDFVIVDLPGAFANQVSGALETADFIGLLTSNDALSIKNTVFSLQNLALLGYDLQSIRLIINQFDRRGLTENEVKEAVGLPIFWRINRDKHLIDSLNKGKPVVADKPKCPASVSIKRLALALAIEYGKARDRK